MVDWLGGLYEWVRQGDPHAAYVVCFPGYRPELVRELARETDSVHLDFRREKLAPLGWAAATLPPESLTDAVLDAMAGGSDVVLQNAEALLAVFDEPRRKGWLAEAMARRWPRRLILPIVLFPGDLPPDGDRIRHLTASEVPEESLLLRLSTLQ